MPAIIAGLFVAYCASLPPAPPSAAVPAIDEKWLAANGTDAKALDDKFGSKAQVACSIGSDEYLKGIALHEFKWDDDAKGFLGDKFDKLSTRSAGNGLLTQISTRAELSNGFGAFEHITFYCLYDVRADKVVKYSRSDPADDLPGASDAVADAPAQPTSIVIHTATPEPSPVATEADGMPSDQPNPRDPQGGYSDQQPDRQPDYARPPPQ